MSIECTTSANRTVTCLYSAWVSCSVTVHHSRHRIEHLHAASCRSHCTPSLRSSDPPRLPVPDIPVHQHRVLCGYRRDETHRTPAAHGRVCLLSARGSAQTLDDGGVGHAAGLTHGLQAVASSALFSALTIVVMIRTPLAPRGCPIAIAPPLTFVFAGSAPVSRAHARAGIGVHSRISPMDAVIYTRPAILAGRAGVCVVACLPDQLQSFALLPPDSALPLLVGCRCWRGHSTA